MAGYNFLPRITNNKAINMTIMAAVTPPTTAPIFTASSARKKIALGPLSRHRHDSHLSQGPLYDRGIWGTWKHIEWSGARTHVKNIYK